MQVVQAFHGHNMKIIFSVTKFIYYVYCFTTQGQPLPADWSSASPMPFRRPESLALLHLLLHSPFPSLAVQNNCKDHLRWFRDVCLIGDGRHSLFGIWLIADHGGGTALGSRGGGGSCPREATRRCGGRLWGYIKADRLRWRWSRRSRPRSLLQCLLPRHRPLRLPWPRLQVCRIGVRFQGLVSFSLSFFFFFLSKLFLAG